MKKKYLFPNYFKIIGLVITSVVLLALVVYAIWFNGSMIKMPSIYYDGAFETFHSEESKGFFVMATCTPLSIIMPLLTIGLIFIGFSKEKIEDEFVKSIREQSLVWATYISAIVFLVGTLAIYGSVYVYVPYSLFSLFLILFIIKFRIELNRENKGGKK